jgi:hypothetical protein
MLDENHEIATTSVPKLIIITAIYFRIFWLESLGSGRLSCYRTARTEYADGNAAIQQ